MVAKRFVTIFVLIGLLITSQPVQAMRTGNQSTVPAVPQAGTHYVDAVNGNNTTGNGSAAAPWKTITYALSQVSGPDAELHVAPGMYDTILGESFPLTMEPGVSLIGSGYSSAILSGTLSTDVVVFPNTVVFSNTTVISGFKITHGDVGVHVYGTSAPGNAPTIQANWITGNNTGIYDRTDGGRQVFAVIKNNLITDNLGRGIYEEADYVSSQAAALIEDNRITGNQGPGIECRSAAYYQATSYCYPIVRHNMIADNSGDGITCRTYYAGACDVQAIGNTIVANHAWGIGRVHDGSYLATSSPTFYNNFVVRNSNGGAEFHGNDNPTLVNNTIAYNNGYGISGYYMTVVNSIVWGQADNVYNVPATYISYSDIGDGEYAGTNNNVSIDPQFADPAHDDVHLLPSSLVRNIADNSIADLPATDIDGDPRILNNTVDMGADESASTAVSLAKSVTPTDIAHLGELLTYTLSITNHSAWSAGGPLITDTLPAETIWSGYAQPSAGYVTVTNNLLRWTGTLPASSIQLITYSVVVKPNLLLGTIITNVAAIDNRTGGITPTLPVTITVGPSAVWDTSTQTVDASYAQPGQRITYTLAARNTGNSPAYDTIVTDTLDNHVTFAAADHGGVFNANRVIWNGLTVTNGAAITLTVAVTISAPLSDTTPIVNQASVSSGQSSFTLPIITTTVYNSPLADFEASPTLGAVPFIVTFTDHSQHATNYLWSYGDGTFSVTSGTHQHFYYTTGLYTVALRVSNPIGSDILTRTGYITGYNAANAYFTGSPTLGLPPLSVTFTNDSTYANQFVWNYGDGVISTVGTGVHTHQYPATGFYTVTLTAIGPYNQHTYTRANYIAVYDQPVASFSATPRQGNVPLLVSFGNSSLSATSYYWDFGDGSGSTAVAPQHYYIDGGTYTVTLRASNPAASDTLVRPAYITVHAPPTADFTAQPTIGIVPLTVTLANTSQLADTYVWNYGDGITSTIAAPTHTHTYAAAGFYTVTLDADSPDGHDTLMRPDYIRAYTLPVAGFSATPITGVAPLSVTFNNSSQFAETFWWDFGDAGTSDQGTPTHVYTASGMYTVSLRAINPGGSTWLTYTNYITAERPPLPDFQAQPVVGFEQLTVTFTNTSQFADSFVWDYGDGITSTIAAFTHSHFYAMPGVYTVTLAGTNQYGTRTLMRPQAITVFDRPAPDFVAVPALGAVPLTVQFTNTSNNADNFSWSFGDGLTSTATNPRHVYTTTGQYTVSLTASNPFTSATISRLNAITVYYQPTIDFNGTPTIGTAPLVVTFTRSSSHATKFWWDYADGTTSDTTNLTHQHTFTAPGVYPVSVTAFNAFTGTTLTKPGYIIVYSPPLPIDFYVDAEKGSNVTGDGTRSNPWRTITYALNRVVGDVITVHVASGVYDAALGEGFPLTMKPGASLLGEGSPTTVIAGNSSTYAVYFSSSATFTETTRLSGFKITNGAEGVRIDGSGSGSSPILEANWIANNYDGIVNHSGYSARTNTVIRNNVLSGNARFGIYNAADSGNNSGTSYVMPEIADNQITGNGSVGVFSYAYGWSGRDDGECIPAISRNLIAYNGASGDQCNSFYAGGCHEQLTDNIIAHNGDWGVRHSEGPYEYWTTNYPKLINNLIFDNASGGAIFFASDEPLLLNNTIADNHATGVARIDSIYGIRDGWPTIVNSIVWGQADDINNVPVDRVQHTDTGDSAYWNANSNLWSNPDFVDPLHENYRVALTSPVIDAGDSTQTALPATDLDGHARIMGTAVDIGAYETVVDLIGSLSLSPDPVGAGHTVTARIGITNSDAITLHTTLTGTLSPHMTPNGPTTWTADITPNTAWTQVFTATVEPGYRGPVTSTIEATTLEGPAGVFTATTMALIPISGLAAINDSPTHIGTPTTFTATIAAGDAVSYAWSFGDLTSSTGAVVTHTYPMPGIYTATVTASNAVSVFTATTSATVTDASITGLKASNDSPTVLGLPTTLTATIQSGTNAAYTWIFGDGTLGIGSIVTHTYSTPGTYTAVVTATNAASTMTTTTSVTITDVPVSGLAAFNNSPTSLGQPTALTATLVAGSNVTFAWSLGDATFGIGRVITHTYPYTGSYTAIVTATNNASLVTATTIVNIIATPLNPRVYLPIVLRAQP